MERLGGHLLRSPPVRPSLARGGGASDECLAGDRSIVHLASREDEGGPAARACLRLQRRRGAAGSQGSGGTDRGAARRRRGRPDTTTIRCLVERLGQRYREAFVTRIRETTIVEAPVEDVWNVVSDPRNLPRWNKHIIEVHDLPEEGLEPGSRYWTELGGAGVVFRVRAQVEEFDPPRYSRIRLDGPLDAIVQTW